jgi:hypothetical protein
MERVIPSHPSGAAVLWEVFGGDPFMNLHREMNRLFDDVFRGNTGQMPSAQGQGAEGGMLAAYGCERDRGGTGNLCRTPGGQRAGHRRSGLRMICWWSERKKSLNVRTRRRTITSWSCPTVRSSARCGYRALSTRSGSGPVRERCADRDRAQDRTAGAVPPHSDSGRIANWRSSGTTG